MSEFYDLTSKEHMTSRYFESLHIRYISVSTDSTGSVALKIYGEAINQRWGLNHIFGVIEDRPGLI